MAGMAVLALSATSAFAAPIVTLTLGGAAFPVLGCTTTYHFVVTGLDADDVVTSASVEVGGASVPLVFDRRTGATAHYNLAASSVPGGVGTIGTGTATVDTNGESGNLNFNRSNCVGGENTQIPEVPLTVVYPALGAVTLAAGFGLRRLRRRTPTISES